MIIKALLWKHLVCSRKKVKSIVLEILSTTVWILLVFLVHNALAYLAKVATVPAAHTDPRSYKDVITRAGVASIHYTSDSNDEFVGELMGRVRAKLKAQKGVFGYPNEAEMLSELKKSIDKKEKSAAVIFHNAVRKPDNLSYTIRCPGNYATGKIKPLQFLTEPNEAIGFKLYKEFVAVQIAIDTSFIELLSKSELKENMSIQPFPYPESIQNPEISAFPFLTQMFIFGYLFLQKSIIIKLITERTSGIKVLLEMMGVNKYYLWIYHFFEHMIIQLICHAIFLFCLKMKNSNDLAIFHNTDILLLECTLLSYSTYAILFAFAFSTLFSEPTMATISLFGVWIAFSLVLKTTLLANLAKNAPLVIATSFLPNLAIDWAFQTIASYEQIGHGVTFNNAFSRTNPLSTSFVDILLVMIVNCILLFFITLYIENINPGPRGIPKPLTYIFQPTYWGFTSKSNVDSSTISSRNKANVNFEEAPKHLAVGVKISNVRKVFYKNGHEKVALDNVSLNIYKPGITALLGHNGAGKTTLMSIITGMIPNSGGEVYVNDLNTKHSMAQIHKSMGLCPQENTYFSDLTVVEHLQFMGLIRGFTLSLSKEDAKTVLTRLNLLSRADEQPQSLSGGEMRRLQLGIALCGNSSVLVLDEPTSGLDSKNRREIWDMLIKLKKSRTILLTTHYMEEADILGDWIAIMNQGKIECYGTPLFLKNKICPGYKLTIAKGEHFNTQLLCDEIEKCFETCDIKYETPKEIQMELISNDSKKLQEFILMLEKEASYFDVQNFRLKLPSIEEVFLRICAGENVEKGLRLPGFSHEMQPQTSPELVKKECIWENVMKPLLYKRILHTKHKAFTICFMFLPLIAGILYGTLENPTASLDDSVTIDIERQMSLLTYNKDDLVILFATDDPGKFSEKKLNGLYGNRTRIGFEKTSNVYDAIMTTGRANPFNFADRHLVALSLDANGKYIGLYSTSVYHALPIVVNLMANIIAAEKLGGAKFEARINTYNWPVGESAEAASTGGESSQLSYTNWALYLTIGLSVCTCILIIHPVDESSSGCRELILMTGINRLSYYFTHFVYDFLFCLLFCMPMFLILIDPYDRFDLKTVGSLFVMTLATFPALFAYIRVVCHKFSNSSYAVGHILMVNLISAVYASASNAVADEPSVDIAAFKIAKWIFELLPSTQFYKGIYSIGRVAIDRANCRQQMKDCCRIWYFSVIKYNIAILVALFVFNLTNILWYEFKVGQRFRNIVSKLKSNDKNVTEVDSKTESESEAKHMNVKDVTLNYIPSYFRRKIKIITPIKSINFSIEKGECFGLIGLSGAGKTSIYKVITGSQIPRLGQVFVLGVTINSQRNKYLSAIGYCPQFDCLGNYLTSRQALYVFGLLRGVPEMGIDEEITFLLELTGILHLADVPVVCCSGGNKRKISLAVALVGFRLSERRGMLLLDEPTTGVDPQSRLILHNAILEAKRSGNSVLLSSHNLNECEYLCGRLGILVEGQMRFVGHTQEVKRLFGRGYSLTVKTRKDVEVESKSRPWSLKEYIEQNYGWTLKDHHGMILQYHVDVSSYGNLFVRMENLKNLFANVLETYAVSEVTLEESFLAFVDSETTLRSNDAA